MPVEITMPEHQNVIVDVLDMLVGKTESILENEEALNRCLDMMLREIVYETAE
jgi:hypothetical protein